MKREREIKDALIAQFTHLIEAAKEEKASAWRTQRYMEYVKADEYLSGLRVGLEIVKHVMGRYV